MSYQPEERYWTDYLRIALPVVGLLLMLGLFWFWAASLIGDEDDDNPDDLAAIATATIAPTQVPTPPSSPSGEQSGNGTDSETPGADEGGEDDQTTDDNSGNNADEEDPDAAEDETSGDDGNGEEAPACDPGEFCEGKLATVLSDDLNVRTEASVDSESRGQLQTGDEVEVTGDPIEDGDITWVPVDTDLGEGFVTSQYIETDE